MMSTFLAPKSRAYPHLDEAASELVALLREHPVHGLTMTTRHYGGGYEVVESVRGDEWAREHKLPLFCLSFGRPQGRASDPYWNDCGALAAICVERKHLRIYGDLSGPAFGLFVGNEAAWERGADQWLRYGPGVNSRLRGEARTYLRYSGRADSEGRRIASHRINPYLVHTDDLGREYSPVGDEPRVFNTIEVLQEMADVVRRITEAARSRT